MSYTSAPPPKMVSIYELREKLMPLMDGVPWAEDALMDLWKMGAPDPSPNARPCTEGYCQHLASGKGARCGKWGCRKERRLLLPTQFAQWWKDMADRQGIELKSPEVKVKLWE